MTKQPHPITPPPELVEQWWDAALHNATSACIKTQLCTQAAQWGADQELEACVEWLDRNSPVIGGFHLRIDRRPKPPRLKEQALAALREAAYMADDAPPQGICSDQIDVIRRALEALDD